MTIGYPALRDANVQTLSDHLVLTNNSAYLQALDPGGAGRNVDLPAVAPGLEVRIDNRADAAEDLTVRLAGGGATIVTISQNEDAHLICDGTTWSSVLSKGTT